jgi:hypothetical protein
MKGFIYILMNPAFPSLIKIGRTTKSPKDRAIELSSTGTPDKFVVVHSAQTNDCISLELKLHLEFDKFRYSKNREFFEIAPVSVINRIEELISSEEKYEKHDIHKESQSVILYMAELDSFGSTRIGLIDAEDDYFIDSIDGLRKCSVNTYLYSEDLKNALIEFYSLLDWKPNLTSVEIQVMADKEFIISKNDFEYLNTLGLNLLMRDLFDENDSTSSVLRDGGFNYSIFHDGKTIKFEGKKPDLFFLFDSYIVLLGAMQDRFQRTVDNFKQQIYREKLDSRLVNFKKKI